MLEIVVLIRIVVRQVLTPNFMIRTSLIHYFRRYRTEHEIQPMQILVPVQVRDLIFVHVERTDGQSTGFVVTRSGKELVFLTYGECTTLDRHHSNRIDITYALVSLEIRGLLVKIIPTGSVADTGIQLALLA